MKKIIMLLFAAWTVSGAAQELNCKVVLNSDQIQGTNKSVFTTLEQAISAYMNNRRWTNRTVAVAERVDCNMTIVINAVNGNKYTAELQVQARRPVYNTSYNTPLLNMKDNDFTFQYAEFDQLEYQENVFTTNLTAMLSYYAYLILGYDADSYMRYGGTPYFQVCENIVSAAQGSSIESDEMKGWKAFDSRKNRYAIVNNLMDDAFKKFRSFYYDYHRLGLDMMANNVDNGRARIAADIPVLREANRARPSAGVISTFLDAKNDELVSIFQKGTTAEKAQVYEILMDVDPTRNTQYDKITQ